VDGLWLISSSGEKCDWDFPTGEPFRNDSELNWRSAVVDADFRPVSLGLPKFLNYGEPGAGELDKIASRAMDDRSALLTAKLDGSLIIRSVWNGAVYFRTRNSFFLGDFEPLVRRIVDKRYPALADPRFCPNAHLHLELISPQRQIILRYPKDDLVLIHARCGHRMAGWGELASIARGGSLNLVEIVDLIDLEDPRELQIRVTELERQGVWQHEGIVIRDPKSGAMCKVKGEEYLKRYRKAGGGFAWEHFVAICREESANTLVAAQSALRSRGFDWEYVVDAELWWEVFCERLQRCETALEWAQTAMRNWLDSGSQLDDHGGFAAMVKREAPSAQAQSLAFALMRGRDIDAFYANTVQREMARPLEP
jgi:hypothetical protein